MLKPIGNKVAVRPDEKETVTESGIILTEKAVEKPLSGIVLAGNTDVKEGDHVLFSRYGYDEFKYEGEILYIVSDSAILAIL